MKRAIGFILVVIATGLVGLAPLSASVAPVQDEEEAKDEIVVVKAGRLITVSGDEYEDATIVIRNGKIDTVGVSVEYPFNAEVIDASDQVVMPGFINPVSALRNLPAGNGSQPNVTMGGEFFMQPEELEDIAAAGYTTLGLVPRGAVFPGRVLVMKTAGEESSDLVVTDEGPVQISFNNPGRGRTAVSRAFKAAEKEIEKIKKAREKWEKDKKKKKEAPKKEDKKDPKPAPKPEPKPPEPKPAPKPKAAGAERDDTARAPGERAPDRSAAPEEKKDDEKASDGFTPPPVNPVYKPLVELLEKEEGKRAIVEFGRNVPSFWAPTATASSVFLHWMETTEKYEFAHGYRIFNSVVARNSPFFVTPETDVGRVSEELGERKALIALSPVINHHAYTRDKYNLGLMLHRAGCTVVYVPERETWTFYAGIRDGLIQMVRSGFPREAILKTVTLNAAKMIGMEKELGSIEKDKAADLVFLSGDPLDYRTSVERVMVGGKLVKAKKRLR